MLNRLQKNKDDQGFTLIELLVVVVIIGVLAAIAIPIFLSQKDKAAESAVKSDLKNASTYLETYYVDNGSYDAATLAALETDGFKKSSNVDIAPLTVTADTYCIEGDANTGTTFHLDSETGTVEEGACA